VVFAAPNSMLSLFDTMPHLQQDYASAHRAAKVAHWILPKTAEIPFLAARWSGAGTSIEALPEGAIETDNQAEADQVRRANAMEKRMLKTDPLLSIGSSLAFEAGVVLLAMGVFVRKDF
jgi:hypothetical protein